MTCHQFRHLIRPGHASLTEAVAFAQHMRRCPHCRYRASASAARIARRLDSGEIAQAIAASRLLSDSILHAERTDPELMERVI